MYFKDKGVLKMKNEKGWDVLNGKFPHGRVMWGKGIRIVYSVHHALILGSIKTQWESLPQGRQGRGWRAGLDMCKNTGGCLGTSVTWC